MPSWTKEQEQAIYQEGTNIIVSAGAGSGKTAVLSERALRIVSSGIDVDRLLILTFTKAAAYEMMIRIRKKIEKAGLKEQLERIEKAYITTFDSFALSIVKKYHDLLNISPSVSIIEEGMINLVKKEMLDVIFEEYYQKQNPLFEKMISNFCVKDDKDLKTGILNINHKLDMKYDKNKYLDKYLKDMFSEEKIASDLDLYFQLIKNELNQINPLIENLELALDGDYCGKVRDVLNGLLNSKNYDEVLENIDIKLPNLPRGVDDKTKAIKAELGKIITKIKKICIYKNNHEIKEGILSTKDTITIIIDIIKELDKRIWSYKKEHNVYEFIDISKLAIQVVEENKEVREELKNYFHEIMIDEYQDTNDLQEIFVGMIENNNVYMVGDIKQSIYRFRNANPTIFKEKYDRYSKQDGGIKIDLNKNFRSRKEVLDDINQIFDYIMDDKIGGANYRDSHQMVFGNNTYLEQGKTSQNYQTEIYQYSRDKDSPYTKDEIEAFIIADDIKKKVDEHYQTFDKDELVLKDINYNDFVILVDRSSKFDLYKKILEYKGIPLTILKDENILNHIEIFLIKNLLKLLIKTSKGEYDEEFKYAFLSIGRSYLYSLPDQELFDMLRNKTFFESEIYQKIKEISSEIKERDIVYLVRKLVYTFDFYEKAVTVGNIDLVISNLEYIQSMAQNLLTLDYTLEDFYHYINFMIEENTPIKIPAGVTEENSVKIMTIHKSKGLEYPVCYYAGLSNRFNVSDLKEKMLFSEKYGIIIPCFKEGYKDTIYKTLYADGFYNEEISEKIRLFYVALTRAKEKMILVAEIEENDFEEDENVISDNTRLKYRSFKEIMKSIYDKVENFITSIDYDKISLTSDYKKRISRNITNYLEETSPLILKVDDDKIDIQTEDKKNYSKKTHELLTMDIIKSMKYGTEVHYILEIMNFKNPDYSILENQPFLKKKIESFLNHEIFKNINNAKIYKEYQFLDKSDTIGVIDCMIVYEDHIDIIDYKLKSIAEEAYYEQLKGYQTFIEEKEGKKTNIYLYSILDEALICLSNK